MILIGRGLKKSKKNKKERNYYLVFRDYLKEKSLVTMARWTHLFPSRTQKLSTVAVKVALGKNNKLPGSFFCLKKGLKSYMKLLFLEKKALSTYN